MFAPVKTGVVKDSNGSLDLYSLARKPKSRGVWIKTTTQFFEAQMDWGRRIYPSTKRASSSSSLMA